VKEVKVIVLIKKCEMILMKLRKFFPKSFRHQKQKPPALSGSRYDHFQIFKLSN